MNYLTKLTKRIKFYDNRTIRSMTTHPSTKKNTDNVMRNLNERDPDFQDATHSWPHYPVIVLSGIETEVSLPDENRDYADTQDALPLGIPFQFESPLFKGKALLRLRHAKSDDPTKHESYFGGSRKRVRQFVIQGRFKQSISMGDLYYGDVYRKPLNPSPPPILSRIIKSFFQRLFPGLLMDLTSKQPKVMTLYAGCANSIRKDFPGEEPDITGIDLKEHFIPNGEIFDSAKERKRFFSDPSRASMCKYDTDHVYTFNTYDDILDMANYQLKIPVLRKPFDLIKTLDGQPLTLSATTKNGQFLYNFCVWHARLSNTNN